jgi:hypothetical protein
MRATTIIALAGVFVALGLGALSCSSSPAVKKVAYAELKSEKTFEHEFPAVWKAIEKTFDKYKVVERDPEEVEALEWKDLRERSLETDWIYGQSRDKYIEYKVNGLPKRKNLQTRVKFELEAKRTLGGTHVRVSIEEEIERLKLDGSSAGWDSVEQIDSSRTNEIIEKIGVAILSAAP